MKLLIVIPALNEEDSIRQVIERSLAARGHIVKHTRVEAVDVTVVSDGSTDRTVEYARSYLDDIELIVFAENRGYGAAIKTGWLQSNADLLGFLDADGTCDPRFFASLCSAVLEDGADIALGCRLHTDSRMPAIRRVGNTLFAWLLSALALQRVRDTASGMRVIRSACLGRLMPLPEGLDFTPAMTTRAMFDANLKIVELDMPYSERSGKSKLRILRDGLRFLKVIVSTTLLHRPTRPLGLVALVMLALAAGWMIYPSWYWWRESRVEEWMVYRFLISELLATVGVLILCTSYLVRKAGDIILDRASNRSALDRLINWRWFAFIPLLLMIAALFFVWDGLRQYVTTGEIHQHWSRFVAMMAFLTVAATLVVTKVLDFSLNLMAIHVAFLRKQSSEGSTL